MVVKRRYGSAHRQGAGPADPPGHPQHRRDAVRRSRLRGHPADGDRGPGGVAIQAVYKIFGSKKTLLSALVDVTVARSYPALVSRVAWASRSAGGRPSPPGSVSWIFNGLRRRLPTYGSRWSWTPRPARPSSAVPEPSSDSREGVSVCLSQVLLGCFPPQVTGADPGLSRVAGLPVRRRR